MDRGQTLGVMARGAARRDHLLMRVTIAIVVLAGCGGETGMQLDAGADAAVDAAPGIDAAPPADLLCTPPSATAPPARAQPLPGTYCVTWTPVDGSLDPYPRYYDRVDIDASDMASARWFTISSGGAKDHFSVARYDAASRCLVAEPFIGPGGYSGSAEVPLCWQSDTSAEGVLAWCDSVRGDAHWTVRLESCP